MTTHLSQLRMWLIVTCALLLLQGLVFWFTPALHHTARASDPMFAQVWPYIDQLEYENDDPQQGRALRWAPMQGVIRLPQSTHANPIVVRITVHTARAIEQPPMQLDVQSATTTTSFMLRPGWRTISLLAMPSMQTEQYALLRYKLTGPILSERRDLGVAVTTLSLSQTNSPRIDGMRYLFVAALWLWIVPLAASRRWVVWSALIPALMLIGALRAFHTVAVYAIPNHWTLLGYLWLMTAVLLLLPYRRAYLAPGWSVVALSVVVALWQFGFGWLGVVLLLVTWCMTAAWPVIESPGRTGQLPRLTWLIVIGVIGVAGLLRIGWLNEYPTGLFRDEARHGGLAWRILAGEWMIYSPLANLPAGYFYISAVPVGLFDASAWSIRIVAAVVGTVSVVVLFWMLAAQWDTLIALWASVILATLLWHVGLSRIGFPATMGPMLTMIAIGAWFRIPQAKWPFAWAICAGVATGLMLMVYHSARLMPLVVALTVLLVLWQQRWAWQKLLPAIIVYAGITLLVTAPIVWYALTQPDNYMRRIGVTSIMTDAHMRGLPVWVALFDNLHAYAGMLFVAGDRNPRHFNLGEPQLNLFESLAFVVGIIWLWIQQRQWLVWLLGWLVIALISGVLSVDAPHALRTVEAIVPVVIIVASGVKYMTTFVTARWLPVLLAVVLITNGAWSATQYYAWHLQPLTQSRFDTSMTNDVRFVQQLAQKHTLANAIIYVPEAMRRSDQGVFLLHRGRIKVWQGDPLALNQSIQNLVVVPIAATVNWPVSAIQLTALPDAMKERYELWCVGSCDDLVWMNQP